MCAAPVRFINSARARTRLKTTTALALVATMSVAPGLGNALTLRYDNSVGGTWTTDTSKTNWERIGGGQNRDHFEDGDDVQFGNLTPQQVFIAEGNVAPNSITFQLDGYVLRSNDNSNIFVEDSGLTLSSDAGVTGRIVAQFETDNNSGAITIDSDSTGVVQLAGDNSGVDVNLTVQNGTLDNRGNYGGTISLDGGDAELRAGQVDGNVSVNNGTLTVAGGTFASSGQIIVDDNASAVVDVNLSTDVDILTAGVVNVNGGTLTGFVTIDGDNADVTNDATIQGTVTVTDGQFENNGTVQGAVNVATDGVAQINGGQITLTLANDGGTVTINGGNMSGGINNNSGSMTIAGAAQGGTLTTGGTLDVNANWTGDIDQTGGTTTLAANVSGTIDVTGGTLDANTGTVSGLVSVGTSGGSLLAGGTVFDGGIAVSTGGSATFEASTTTPVTNAGGTVTVNDMVTLTGNYTASSGDTNNNGTILGKVTIDGAAGDVFTNNNIVNGNLDINGGTFEDEDASASVTGVTRNFDGILNHRGGNFAGGIVSLGGTTNLLAATTNTITNTGGTVNVSGGVTLGTNYSSVNGTTNNSGTITRDLFVGGGNTHIINNQNGGVLSGNVTVAGAAQVRNETGGSMTGDVRVTGGTLFADGGSFTNEIVNAGGEVRVTDATAANIRNQSGTTRILAGQTLTGDLLMLDGLGVVAGNINGDLTVRGTSSVSSTGDISGVLLVEGGLMDVNGGSIGGGLNEAVVTGGRLNLANATLTSGLRGLGGTAFIDGPVAGDVVNAGAAITVRNGSTLTGDVLNNSGDFTMAGTLEGSLTQAGGTVTVSGDVNTGFLRSNSGALTITGGTMENRVVNAGGSATLSGVTFSDGFTNVNGGSTTTVAGQVTGDITNAGGIVTVNGALDGQLIQTSGTTNQNSRINSVLLTGGTFNASTQITTDAIVAGGIFNANGSNILGDLRATGGNVNVVGTNTMDIINDGAAVATATGSRVNGTFRSLSGSTSNNGTLAMGATITGGTVSNQANGQILGDTVLAGGTLNANGGDFGRILLNGGAFALNADTTGDIVNNGNNVAITSARTLFGSFTNNTGSLTLRGTLRDRLVINGGNVATFNSSQISDDLRLNAGNLTVNGGTVVDGISIAGGSATFNNTVTASLAQVGGTTTINGGAVINGNFNQTAGTVTNDGAIESASAMTGGTFNNNGDLNAALTLSGNATFNQEAGGDVAGRVELSGNSELNANGGTFGGRVANRGGTFNVTENTTVNTPSGANFGFINANGTLDIAANKTLTADVRNDAAALIELDGTLDGNLTNRGTVNARGDVTGTLINTGTFNTDFGSNAKALTLTGPTINVGGLLDNTGVLNVDVNNIRAGNFVSQSTAAEVTISNGLALVSQSDAEFRAGSLTINDGALAGAISFAGAVDVDLTDATLEGDVTSATLITASGSNEVTAGSGSSGSLTFTDSGRLAVREDGLFTVEGDLVAGANTRLTIASGATLGAGTLVSDGLLNLGANAFLQTDVLGTNNGLIEFGSGAEISGDFRNTGAIRGAGTLTFVDGLNGGGRVNLQTNSGTDDEVRIGGELGNQRFDVDIDLSGSTGQSDQIVMTSDAIITGNVRLNFNVLGEGGEQDNDVVVLNASAGQNPDAYTIDVSGLPAPDDIIIYGATINNQGDVIVFDALNQGISSLAGNIVLAQSLIGSVINRPSSPFVSGLAFEDENPCGAGTWARAIGGQADSSGRVEQTNGDRLSFDGSIEADYYGVQVGADWACFNGFYNGWDLAFGGIVGANFGQSNQPVFAPDPNEPDGLSDTLTSTTDVNFTQTYGGVYVAAVRDALAVDLQYRVEQTEFTANNVGANGGPGLGLEDETFNSNASTLSGAISYAYPIPDTNFTIVPTAGFAFSQVETDPIVFADRGVIQIDDFESRTGFVGATLSRTRFGADGVSALTQFGTVTVYNDFAENPTSTFTPADGSEPTTLSTENLGRYGELSAGVNYVRILQPGEFGAAKQFNASIRSDLRISDRLESWGVTAQARIQF